ncbi:unnamed protein product, partial [Laminaria digitata]
PSPQLGRRRATWSSARDARATSRAEDEQALSDEAATARAALVPPSLQLQWETQGVSGRAYQKDGNLALYRKKKMAARRRLSKHGGIRDAIESGWWPYLPVRWIILNDTHVLKILPREVYTRLFASMYTTLVPTAGVREAEDTAAWEYTGDAQGLPPELTRVGITLGAFCDALFAVADNVRKT